MVVVVVLGGGGCLDLRSAPFSFLFAVLRNSLISPQQWRSSEKSRPLHCEPLRVSALFDSVFRGSLDAPLIFAPKPLALVLFGSAIISQTRF